MSAFLASLATLDWMVVVLVMGIGLFALSLWRAHINPENNINLIDLFLQNGRMDRAATVFMLAFALTTWVIVDLEIHSKLTEGYLGLYSAAWVGPLIAKVIYQQKEMTKTSTVLVSETKKETTP